MTNSFWPEGLHVENTQTLLDVAAPAQKEWLEKSGGIISLEISELNTEDKRRIVFAAKHVASGKTQLLFDIETDLDKQFPVMFCQDKNLVYTHFEFRAKLVDCLTSRNSQAVISNLLIGEAK